jgi:hypothetical protein
MEVNLRDTARVAGDADDRSPALCVFGLLEVAKNKTDGGQIWRNYSMALRGKGVQNPEAHLTEKGVSVFQATLIGWNEGRTRRVVRLEEVPKLLANVFPKPFALAVLGRADLLETLIARGLAANLAKDLINEQKILLEETPEDLAAVKSVLAVFGVPETKTAKLRRARVPQRGGQAGRTVLVFSAIDLVMLAKGCNYNTAQLIVYKIFKDYYEVNLEAEELGEELVNQSDRLIHYRISFLPGEAGRKAIALDIQGACELLCLIPGSDFSSSLRRRAVDTLLRVEGGDSSLIDRIIANRKFQQYLQEKDPDHPLRAVGEHAEQREAEEAAAEARRRENVEDSIEHRKRMEEFEADVASKRVRRMALENSILENQLLQQCNETHERFRRERADTIRVNLGALRELHPEKALDELLSPRARLRIEDELLTGLLGKERSRPELGRPLYCTVFLRKKLFLKEASAKARAPVFGRHVVEAMRVLFPDYDLGVRTNRMVDGQDRDVHSYFEVHLPAFEKALQSYLSAHPIREDELTPAGLAAKASEGGGLLRFFQPSHAQGSSSSSTDRP